MPTKKNRITVLVFDHIAESRTRFVDLLQGHTNSFAAKGVATYDSLQSTLFKRRIDILLTGIDTLQGSLKEFLFMVRKSPDPPLVVAYTANLQYQHLRACIAAGYNGVVEKNISESELVKTLSTISPDRACLSSYLVKMVADHVVTNSVNPNIRSLITERELKVLRLVGRGYTTTEISKALGLRRQVINSVKKALYAKAGSADDSALLAFAKKQGWI